MPSPLPADLPASHRLTLEASQGRVGGVVVTCSPAL